MIRMETGMTVAALREALKDLPDDMKVCVVTQCGGDAEDAREAGAEYKAAHETYDLQERHYFVISSYP